MSNGKVPEKGQAEDRNEQAQDPGRRDALKAILAAGGVVTASLLPAKWNPAVVEALADTGNCGQGHQRGRGRGHGRGRGRGHDGCDEGPPTTTASPTTTGQP